MMPVQEQSRFIDKGVHLQLFAKTVFSVCPNCSGPVLIAQDSPYEIPYRPENARATCLCCSFQRSESKGEWFGPVNGTVKSRCRNCGFKWLKKTVRFEALKSEFSRSALVPCPSCGLVEDIGMRFSIERFGSAIDPAFGLPLWLQVPCCGHVLWAFNKDHLSKLRQYTAAELRERVGVISWSVFSRLPAWMTSAKNRNAVLKGIGRLEEKLESIGA
jgi:hypothetical protein